MAVHRHFASYSDARRSLRAVLDAAHDGLVTTVVRDGERYAVTPVETVRQELVQLRPSNAQVCAEGGGWAVIIPGLPVHGDGETLDDALIDAVEALREYAEDWNERLRLAPNHASHGTVVRLVEFSSDDQLRDWLLGGASGIPQSGASDRLQPA